MPRFVTLILLTLMSAGCSTFDFRYGDDEAQRLTRKILGPTPSRADEIQTLALTDDMKRALDERIDPRWHASMRLKNLREFLFNPDELGVSYLASATRTAAEVWEQQTGNCLAMTNLFVAAARHVGIEARFTVVEVTPTWDHSGSTMVRYEHVVATGRLQGGDEYVMDFLPEFVLDQSASVTLTDREALRLFYSNLGAEALVSNQPAEAVEHLRKALHIDRNFSNGWNNMGAALRRLKKFEQAEFAYQRALDIDPGNLSALSNLAQFYQSRGRRTEASALMRRVTQYRDRNPYFHFYLARRLFEEGEYDTSLDFLQRSIQLKRDEPQFYAAMAETYEKLGDEKRVDKYTALAKKHRESTSRGAASSSWGHRFFVRTIEL